MATKKKLLQAAAGTAAASGGAGGLNVEQVFSTYLYDGNGSSQVIENGINLGQSNDGGSFELFGVDGDEFQVAASTDFEMGSGDFTVECFIRTTVQSSGDGIITYATGGGASNTQWGMFTGYAGATSVDFYLSNGSSYFANTGGGNVTDGDWHHVAFCRSGSSGYLFVDGTQVGSTLSLGSTSLSPTSLNLNIGSQDSGYSFNGNISNVRIVKGTALYTANFTAPTSALTAVTNTVLLTGQGSASEVTNDNSSSSHSVVANGGVTTTSFGPFDAADAGEGGLVWTKSRTGSQNHWLYTTAISGTKGLISNDTASITSFPTYNELSSYNANGFTLGTASNGNQSNLSGEKYASWTFRKAPKFFTCVQYTGTGSSLTINHDLGVEPAVIIIKRTNTTGNWIVFTDVVDGTMDYLYLNDTSASADGSTLLSKSSTSFTLLQSFLYGNASGSEYVAYLFAHNDGDGDFGPTGDQDIIKCGSYTGTGSAGNEIDLGFEAQWVLIRRSDSAEDWFLYDVMRGMNNGSTSARLLANTSAAEDAPATVITATSTGFKLISINSAVNGSGGNYIYIAIRRGPMAVPTDATDVFAVDTLDSTGSGYDSNFVVDMAFERNVSSASDTRIASRLTGATTLRTNTTEAEGAQSSNVWDFMDGWFYDGTSNSSKYSWMWKRAPSFCDVVAYTGNGTAQTITHNLGVTPEFILLKNRSTVVQWTGYHKDLNGGTNPAHYKIVLNQTNGEGGSSHWNYTSPTSSDFTVGSSMSASSNNYIAYLFASLDGVSKVGSFTMAGSDINVDCGFSSGARFVLLKRTDSTGNWLVFDSERGIVAGADPYLLLNTTDGEDVFGALDIIDPYSSGFTAVSANIANGNWIFYAIA